MVLDFLPAADALTYRSEMDLRPSCPAFHVDGDGLVRSTTSLHFFESDRIEGDDGEDMNVNNNSGEVMNDNSECADPAANSFLLYVNVDADENVFPSLRRKEFMLKVPGCRTIKQIKGGYQAEIIFP